MFDGLSMSPMMTLMLLLYGLLIAVILVLWTALDLGGRRRSRNEGRQESRRPQREPSRTAPEPVTRQESTPVATPVKESAASRRAADSDSVISYTVRPRVAADGRQPAEPGDSGTPAAPQPAATRARPSRPERVPTADVEFPTGRDSRKPSREQPRTVAPVRPPPPRTADGAGNPVRRKSEDAFERFLRSSSDDNDDY